MIEALKKLFTAVMSFRNHENECVTTSDGRKFWISRSAAVVGVIAIDGHVLMVKRGDGCSDEVGKWVLPCGYVDWDENLKEAIWREVKEETGLNLINIRDYAMSHGIIFGLDSFDSKEGDPAFVRSNPGRDKKQNISMYMVLELYTEEGKESMPLPEPDLSQVNPKETADVKWFISEELRDMDEKGLIGFNHFEYVQRIIG